MPPANMTKKRQAVLEAALRSWLKPDDIDAVLKKANASAFLHGRNSRSWRATFDWLFDENNFAKVKEGNYDDDEIAKSFDTEDFFRAAVAKQRT